MNGFQMNGRTVDPQKQSVIVELLLLKKTQARLQQKCVRTHFSFVQICNHPVKKRAQKLMFFANYKHFHYANHNYCRISSFEENPDQIATKMCKDSNDLSVASTKTKYMKLNTKTQNIFCRLNENLTTFLYT